ncbi:hypothetical protein HOY80DRAFT_1063979 [Tuber brumale]|nr:hypothetical protein HOY80DRAFT_1063979 [Tuber brumale]
MVDLGRSIDAHIVVGTPGTVLLIRPGQLPARHIMVFAVDYVNNILGVQRLGDLCLLSPNPRETFPQKVAKYAKGFAPNANHIALKRGDVRFGGLGRPVRTVMAEGENLGFLLNPIMVLQLRRQYYASRNMKQHSRFGAECKRIGTHLLYSIARARAPIETAPSLHSVRMVVNSNLRLDLKGRAHALTYLPGMGPAGKRSTMLAKRFSRAEEPLRPNRDEDVFSSLASDTGFSVLIEYY